MKHHKRNFTQYVVFTLVELLVIISIIAILTSMILPGLKNAREKSKRIGCLSNLKQISTGMFLYANSFNGFFPGIDTSYPDHIDRNSADDLAANGVPVPKPREGNIWHCPSAAKAPSGKNDGAPADAYYLFNYENSLGTANYMIMANWKDNINYVSTQQRSPSTTSDKMGPLVGDCVNNWTGPKNNPTLGKIITSPHKMAVSYKAVGGNNVFSDGHGKWFSIKDLRSGDEKWKDSTGGNKYYWIEE